VKRFVTDNYQRAHTLLSGSKDILLKMADALAPRAKCSTQSRCDALPRACRSTDPQPVDRASRARRRRAAAAPLRTPICVAQQTLPQE